MFTFAAMMMVVGGWMLLAHRRETPADHVEPRSRPRLAYALFAGAAVGAVTGFLGVGGGNPLLQPPTDAR